MITLIKKYSIFALILALSFWSFRPLLSLGFFTIHDNQQIVRLAQLDKSLSFGQFPVRWVEDLGFGLGYPLFNFYPPLVYYLGEVFHLGLGTGFIDSIKLVWFVALVGSGLAMYLLAREFFGKVGGLVAAILYVYAPYHAVDAYVRGALAELFSFVWLPLILYGSYKTHETNGSKWAILTGIFLALLMLTHNLVFLPFFGLFIFWYFGLVVMFRRDRILSSVFYLLSSIVLAFGLTAFFWLPALAEKQYTLVDQLLTQSLASYKIHFLCPEQLVGSVWGYGGSGAGCLDGMSFSVGRLHLLLAILAFGLYIWGRARNYRVISVAFLLLLAAIFMTLPVSAFVWERISPLWYLQFPWRFVEFAVLFAAFLAGGFIAILRQKIGQIIVAVTVLAVVIIRDGRFFVPQTYLPTATDAEQTSDYQTKWVVSSTSFEYLPKGIATKMTDLGTVWVDIGEAEVKSQKLKVENIRGDFEIKEEKFAPHKFKVAGVSKNGAKLQFTVANFPGWKVRVNGREEMIDDNNKYKLITVSVPAGESQAYGEFMDTLPRKMGNGITMVTIGSLGLLAYAYKRNKT